MRMSRGISDDLVQRAAWLLPKTSETLDALAEQGLCEHVDGRWTPTERGWLCGNQLYGALSI